MEVSVTQAQMTLDSLIQRLATGERVILTRDGVPVAEVVSVTSVTSGFVNGSRKPGWGKGLVTYIAPDFDEPLW